MLKKADKEKNIGRRRHIIKKHTKILLYFVILCVLIFIWANSLDNQEVSASKSNYIRVMVLDRLARILPEDNKVLLFAQQNLRKCAHFIEFALLGAVMLYLKAASGKISIQNIYNILSFSVIVAVADEFIQIYTGRGSSVRDVVIDFCGFLTGSVITAVIFFIVRLFKSASAKRKETT